MLGEVLKILEMIITIKKWIIHHHSGWQPITITFMETKGDTNSSSGIELDQTDLRPKGDFMTVVSHNTT